MQNSPADPIFDDPYYSSYPCSRSVVLGVAEVARRTACTAMRRSLLGVHPESLLECVGLRESVERLVEENLRPWCRRCEREIPVTESNAAIEVFLREAAVRPKIVPVIVVAVRNMLAEVSLIDFVEMVGAARVVACGYIKDASEITESEGCAVIGIFAASELEAIVSCVAHWFTQGGSEVEVFEFAAKDERAIRSCTISQGGVCPGCQESFSSFSKDSLLGNACVKCGGEGWREIPAGRASTEVVACEECDGFGGVHPHSWYRFCGTPLLKLSRVSFAELLEMLPQVQPIPDTLQKDLQRMIRLGLGACSLGRAVQTLSLGERARLSLVIAALAQCRSVILDVTDPRLGLYGEGVTQLFVELAQDGISTACTQQPSLNLSLGFSASSQGVGFVRQVFQGPLSIDNFEFQLGSCTYILGEIGSGKTYLLDLVIRNRFLTRKANALRDDFGQCTYVSYINPIRPEGQTIASLLGLSELLANLFGASIEAKKSGCQPKDFLLSRPSIGEELGWKADMVRLGSRTFREIVSAPLAAAREMLQFDDVCWQVLSGLSQALPEHASLISQSDILDGETAWWAYVKARLLIAALDRRSGLGSSARNRRSIQKPLVLLDGCCGIEPLRLKELSLLIAGICEDGGTVIAADKRSDLLSGFGCAWQLVPSASNGREDPRFESRFARMYSLVRL